MFVRYLFVFLGIFFVSLQAMAPDSFLEDLKNAAEMSLKLKPATEQEVTTAHFLFQDPSFREQAVQVINQQAQNTAQQFKQVQTALTKEKNEWLQQAAASPASLKEITDNITANYTALGSKIDQLAALETAYKQKNLLRATIDKLNEDPAAKEALYTKYEVTDADLKTASDAIVESYEDAKKTKP